MIQTETPTQKLPSTRIKENDIRILISPVGSLHGWLTFFPSMS